MKTEGILEFITHAPKIFIYLTTRCNIHCKHCYLGFRLKQDLKFHPNDVIKILDSFSKVTGKKDVTFLGGEPIFYPEINKILRHAKESGYYVRLDTNGFYDTTLLQKMKLEYVDEVSISLDGSTPDIHDKIRTSGSFNLAVKNINYLKDIGKNIRVTTTVVKHNLSDVPKIAKFVEKLGVNILNLHLLSINGNAKKHPELWVLPKEWLCLIIMEDRLQRFSCKISTSLYT